MKIYFVRHGSTNSLEKKICQPDCEPLSQKGHQEAQLLAKRFQDIKIDLLISSSHTRAIQTAKYILKKFEVSKLFTEVQKPKEVVGKSHHNKEVKEILKKIEKMSLKDINWHYSDEENYQDLRIRATKALNYLKNLRGENVVVVSHGTFICYLVGLIILDKSFSIDIFLKLKKILKLSKTGVSILNYDGIKWELECWNDVSHCLE